MWEGYYGTEPFDLRLTVLRLFRGLGWILLATLAGTVIFGGGYYVKNVRLGEPPRYEQTITCKLEYTDPPVQSGDYYINEMTWNTYVDSGEFERMVWNEEPFLSMDIDSRSWGILAGASGADAGSGSMLSQLLSAKVASDIHVPSFTVSCLQEKQTEGLSEAVQRALTGAFTEATPELLSVQVIDVSPITLVYPDVRPVRAVILSAVLSCFFAVVFFLLREIGADSVWLPATLRRRYGLAVLGTVQSAELAQNAGYLFKLAEGAVRIGVCSTEADTDLQNVTKALQEKLQEKPDWKAAARNVSWETVEFVIGKTEATGKLRQADGVLLVVPAGLHAGKKLEYMLEFLKTQDIAVTAALLWEADEGLIKGYYFLRA